MSKTPEPPQALQITVFFKPFPSGKGGSFELYVESENSMTQLAAASMEEVNQTISRLTGSWQEHEFADFDGKSAFPS